MDFIRRHSRTALVAVCCLGIGVGASAIASAGAVTGSSPAGHKARHVGGLRRLSRRAVQGSLVVYTRSGFVTVHFHRGKVDSVSGNQLTMTEGTKKASYKTVTLTVPAGARVRDDRKPASLSALTVGQRVMVVQAPKRTVVNARGS